MELIKMTIAGGFVEMRYEDDATAKDGVVGPHLEFRVKLKSDDRRRVSEVQFRALLEIQKVIETELNRHRESSTT
jgi:hypothetical protein